MKNSRNFWYLIGVFLFAEHSCQMEMFLFSMALLSTKMTSRETFTNPTLCVLKSSKSLKRTQKNALETPPLRTRKYLKYFIKRVGTIWGENRKCFCLKQCNKSNQIFQSKHVNVNVLIESMLDGKMHFCQ